jgi:tellurite resistance protein
MPDPHTPENVIAIPGDRLKYFPVTMFAILMGLSGLSIAWLKAADWFGAPTLISRGLVWADTLIFAGILITYLLKGIRYPQEVAHEFHHPVRINFFAALSISLLLLATIYLEVYRPAAFWLWSVGAGLQLFFTLNTLSYWIGNNLEIQHSNPAWFIPIVGNVIVPVAGVEFVGNDLLIFYFSIGIFFWVVMTAILFNRIIFHHQMAAKFTPTLFIFIAPPAVAMIAYVRMTGHFDFFATMLLDLALFFTLLVLFMVRSFLGLRYFISWWAFTFPLTAVTIATMVAWHMTRHPLYYGLSWALLALATSVVLVVAWQTLRHMFRKEICVME